MDVPETCATATTTSGCVSNRTRRRGHHRPTPPRSWATSSSWSCPPWAATSQKGEAFGVIESVKTASDLYAPLGGEVLAVNDALATQPELVNAEPYAAGWMVRLRLDDPAMADGLKDAGAYRAQIGG